jgi:hypothetical protein
MNVAAHRERQGLDAMTKSDLVERAKKLKIDVTTKMTKDELIRVVSAAKNAKKKSG